MTALTSWTNTASWPLLLISILTVDVAVLFLTRYFPQLLGRSLNRWYDQFGLSAVIADVLVIAIGFGIARWIYSTWFAESGLWSCLGILVGVQLVHDILFYLAVILPIPRGENAMMDVFKDYAASGGAKILAGDAALVLGSAAVFLGLEKQAAPLQWMVALLVTYTLPYILTTNVRLRI